MSELAADAERYGRTLVLLLVSFGLAAFLCQWVLWMFGLGRFRKRPSVEGSGSAGGPGAPIRYLLAELVAGIITEFRHLLALVIVMLFATALMLAMYYGYRDTKMEGLIEGAQAVTAVLGGLLGSIIGYYFGESAARGEATAVIARSDSPEEEDPIRPASTPSRLGAPAGPDDEAELEAPTSPGDVENPEGGRP